MDASASDEPGNRWTGCCETGNVLPNGIKVHIEQIIGGDQSRRNIQKVFIG